MSRNPQPENMDRRCMEYQTWQFYSTCNRVLGLEFMQRLFKRSRTQIYRWAADPDFVDDLTSNRNPLDRVIVLISRLCELGREDVARSLVARLALAVGGEFTVPAEQIAPSTKTIAEECLGVLPSLAHFHDVCNDPESTLMEVRAAKDAIRQALDQSEAAALGERRRQRGAM
jgi:hypothetical protein